MWSKRTLPGGTVKSKIHPDGIIGAPTIYLDDELILEKGKFVAEFQVCGEPGRSLGLAASGPKPPAGFFTLGRCPT